MITLCCLEVQGGNSLARLEIMASRCGMWSEPSTSADESDAVLPVWERVHVMAETTRSWYRRRILESWARHLLGSSQEQLTPH